MAADLSVRVSVDGSQAVAQAKAVGDAMTQMGQAGDTAAAKVAAAGTKMSAPMREATAVAQQAQGIFSRLQMSMGQPVSQQAAITAMGELQRAMVLLLQVQRDAEASGRAMGGSMAGTFKEVATTAASAAAAFEGIVAEMKAMAAAGAAPAEVMGAIAGKVAAVTAAFDKMGASQKAAFEAVSASAQAVAGKTADAAAAAEVGAAARAGVPPPVAVAAAPQAAATEQATQKVTAALKEEGVAIEANTAKLAREGQEALKTIGIENELANKVLSVGQAFKTLGASIAEGGAGVASFMASMVAFTAAMKAVDSVLETFKEGMKSAAEEEKLSIGLQDVVGSSEKAEAQMEKLKDFVTGPFGAAFKLDDVAQGVRKLELLTGQTQVNQQQLEMLGAAAEVSGQAFSHVAQQYGKVVDLIRLGLPVRAQLLIQMQQEGLITAQTVSKIETLVKAHTDNKTILAALDAGMNQSRGTAQALAGTYGNLAAQLKQTFDVRVAEPFGAAINKVLEQIIPEMTKLFTGHEADIKRMADSLEYNLLYAFFYVRDNGFEKAFKEAADNVAKYIQDNWPSWMRTVAEKGFENWKAAGIGFIQWFTQRFIDDWKQLPQSLGIMPQITTPEGFYSGAASALLGRASAEMEAKFSGYADSAKAAADAAKDGTDATKAQTTAQQTGTTALDRNTAALNGVYAGLGTLRWGGPETPEQKAAREAAEAMGAKPPETPPKAGEAAPVETAGKAAKEAKDQFKALNDYIQEITRQEKLMTDQVRLYETQVKAGMITADQAASKTQAAYQAEIDQLERVKPVLQGQEQSLQRQVHLAEQLGDPKKLETLLNEWYKVHDAEVAAETKAADYQAKIAELGTGTFWQNFTQGIREATAAWGTFGQQTIALGKQITDQLASGVGNAITALVTGSGKLQDAFKQMATSIINDIDQMIAKLLIEKAVSSLFGVSFPTSGTALAHSQYGGVVVGPSGPDRVAGMLTAGEYVMSKPAVDRYGIALMEQMNRSATWATFPRHFAAGGIVDAASASMNIPPNLNAGSTSAGNVSVSTTINMSQGGGAAPTLRKADVSAFHAAIEASVKATIAKEKRPGGLLNRNTG